MAEQSSASVGLLPSAGCQRPTGTTIASANSVHDAFAISRRLLISCFSSIEFILFHLFGLTGTMSIGSPKVTDFRTVLIVLSSKLLHGLKNKVFESACFRTNLPPSELRIRPSDFDVAL